MILNPWSAEDLDQREEIAYGLVQRGLRATTDAALTELESIPTEEGLTAAEAAAVLAWGLFVQGELDPFLADTFTQGAELVADGLSGILDVPPVGSESAEIYLSSVANRLTGVGANLWKDIQA